MKNQPRFGGLLTLALLFFLLFSTACNEDSTTTTPATAQAVQDYGSYPPQCDISQFAIDTIPHSDYYPLPAATLEEWVNVPIPKRQADGKGASMRAHAYRVFADLQRPVTNLKGQTVWRWQTWPTATQALKENHHSFLGVKRFTSGPTNLLEINRRNGYLETTTDEIPIDLPPPGYKVPDSVCINFPPPDPPVKAGCIVPVKGCRFQNNGDVMIAGVIYNRDAYNWIQNNNLNDWKTVADKWKEVYDKPASERSIKDFPNTSIVLKPMFWPVRQDGFTALPVWRDSIANKNYPRYSGFEEQDIWNIGVAITTGDTDVVVDSVTFLYDVYTDTSFQTRLGPNTFYKPKVVSINDFYHRKISAGELDSMDTVDRAILDQSAYWCYNRPFKGGDYIALIAMHVITKEMPEWTLQTFWWSDEPTVEDSKYAKARDSVANPPNPTAFNHYMMVSVYGQETLPKTGTYGEWPLSFNPYIELAAAHPIRTSCRNCHLRGAFPNQSQRDTLNKYYPSYPKIDNYAFYLRPVPGFPGPLDTFDVNNPVMDELLIMDFQWTLTDRLVIPTPK